MQHNTPHKNPIEIGAGNLIFAWEKNTTGYKPEVWCVVDHSQTTQNIRENLFLFLLLHITISKLTWLCTACLTYIRYIYPQEENKNWYLYYKSQHLWKFQVNHSFLGYFLQYNRSCIWNKVANIVSRFTCVARLWNFYRFESPGPNVCTLCTKVSTYSY